MKHLNIFAWGCLVGTFTLFLCQILYMFIFEGSTFSFVMLGLLIAFFPFSLIYLILINKNYQKEKKYYPLLVTAIILIVTNVLYLFIIIIGLLLIEPESQTVVPDWAKATELFYIFLFLIIIGLNITVFIRIILDIVKVKNLKKINVIN